MRTAFLVLFAASVAWAAEIALHEQPLPEVKATIQIPEGWTSFTESDEGVFVYHLGKGGQAGGPDPLAITLSVTTKVPDRTTQSPSAYAAALIDMSQDEGPNSPTKKGQFNGLPSLRSEYAFESDKGKMRAVNIAIPNDKTGTLYFFAWQAPVEEPAEEEAVREKVVASVKLDPGF
ncbi:MAG: hypothetical protein WC076_09275 [Terrimicrobiaceae bacterium]|jgi:hypothetical protein